MFYNEKASQGTRWGEMEVADLDQCSSDGLAGTIGQLHAVLCATERQLLVVVAAYDRREAWRADASRATRTASSSSSAPTVASSARAHHRSGPTSPSDCE